MRRCVARVRGKAALRVQGRRSSPLAVRSRSGLSLQSQHQHRHMMFSMVEAMLFLGTPTRANAVAITSTWSGSRSPFLEPH